MTQMIRMMNKSADIIKKIQVISCEKNSNICFSADNDNPIRVIEILEEIGPHIVICKIHFDIYKFTSDYDALSFKNDLIRISKQYDFLLMEDRKFFDISYIVEKQFSFFDGWIDLVTVHGMVNDAVVKKINTGVLLVANMSNNTYDITNDCIELCKNNSNIVGFITQKNIVYDKLLNLTPGISFDDVCIDDQSYRNINNINCVNMPDIIIVGRAIYNSDNPLQTVFNIKSKVAEKKIKQ